MTATPSATLSATDVPTAAVDQLLATITGGGWIAPALRSGGVAAESTAARPVDRLAAMGLGQLTPLVEPVQQAVDQLWCDGSVAAFEDAWRRAAAVVDQAGRQLAESTGRSATEWSGDSGDRYRRRGATTGAALASLATVMTANATAARMMGEAVGRARLRADELLNQLVDELATYVRTASAAADGMTAEVLSEASRLVALYASPIADLEEMLRQTATGLANASTLGQGVDILTVVRECLALTEKPAAASTSAASAGGLLQLAVADGQSPSVSSGSAVEPAAARGFFATAAMSHRTRKSGGDERDCDEEHIQCVRDCWNSKPPWPLKKHKEGHYQHCQTKCLEEYMRCEEEKEQKKGSSRSFFTMRDALAWLGRNPEVAIGTLVVVAGASYVVAIGAAGALILVLAGQQ